MKIRAVAPLLCGAALLSSTGCQTVNRCCSSLFAARATTFADTTPIPEKPEKAAKPADDSTKEASFRRAETNGIDEAGANNLVPEPPAVNRRFNIPEELPGADAGPLVLPPMNPTQSIVQRKSLADALFPNVEPAKVEPGPDADSAPLTLSVMQQMAVDNSPVIRQAAADVEQARGKAVQAGLYPNPTFGYEGDTIGTARTAGYNGVFFTQEFVTADKLTLAQNVALNNVRAAQADLRKARVRLASDVRRNYFKVLIAQEQLKFNRAIAKLSEEVYRAQIDLVTGGESAPYEPLQLRVFAVQARNAVTTASNSLDATWRHLHAVEVLQDPAGRRHRCEPATNATTFSQPSCDALPQLPHRGPRQHRIRSPPLHDSESQRYSIRVSLAESVEAVCQPWPCVEPQRFGWIVA